MYQTELTLGATQILLFLCTTGKSHRVDNVWYCLPHWICERIASVTGNSLTLELDGQRELSLNE